MAAQNVAFWILAVAMAVAAIGVVRSKNVVHAALFLVVVLAGAAAQYILLARRVRRRGCRCSSTSAPSSCCSCSASCSRARRCSATASLDNNQRWPAAVVSLFLLGVLTALLVDAFGDDEIKLDDELAAGRADRSRSPTRSSATTSSRSRSCRCCCSPRWSAPS